MTTFTKYYTLVLAVIVLAIFLYLLACPCCCGRKPLEETQATRMELRVYTEEWCAPCRRLKFALANDQQLRDTISTLGLSVVYLPSSAAPNLARSIPTSVVVKIDANNNEFRMGRIKIGFPSATHYAIWLRDCVSKGEDVD